MIRVHSLVGSSLRTEEGIEALERHDLSVHAWFQVLLPDPEECAALVRKLGIHELAMEDALREGHPPKLEDFDDHLFLIAHTPVEPEDEAETRKLAIFIAKTWVVTVRRVDRPILGEAIARVARNPAKYLQAPVFLAHFALDHMTDRFERRVEDLLDAVSALDHAADPDPSLMERIGRLRMEIAELTRIVRSQRDVCQSLSRSEHPLLPKRARPYLRDVYDHVVRVLDLLESSRETLSAARDTHLAAVNNRLSEIMRVLTVIATIMMPLSLVAGIYGMNFASMPGLQSAAGFWITVGGMVLLAGAMLVFFKRRGWL